MVKKLLILAGLSLIAWSCRKEEAAVKKPGPAPQAGTSAGSERVTSSGLRVLDRTVGQGVEAMAGNKVTVHYTGTLTNGQKFDSSLDRNQPFVFNLGAGQVIRGWDEGVAGMKAGGKRRLYIPSELGYGSRGAGGVIGPNADLIFEIELLKIE